MTPPKVPGAKAILLTEDNRLLLLYRGISAPTAPNTWTVPGGHVDEGEDPDETIYRELEEEIGYAPTELKKLDIFENDWAIIHIYYGKLDKLLSELTLGEEEKMELFTLTDAAKLPRDDQNEFCLQLAKRLI